MGNQLAAPQKLAADVGELPVVVKDTLGGGRLIKTLLCVHDNGGLVVVKVYHKRGEGTPLAPYEQKLREIRQRLAGVERSHVWPPQAWRETAQSAYLLRQHLWSNLYDRLGTRPFLTIIEKRWVAYQLLQALAQAHRAGVCHGDIKCENLLLTSWGWLYLADWGPYKPTYLPADNPADFSFFFDTGGRRRCYLAPERFFEAPADVIDATAPLTPEMDVFAAGCCIGELLLDGNALFDLGQLLAYRRGDASHVRAMLAGAADPLLAQLAAHMIQLNPGDRWSADQYLSQWPTATQLFPPSMRDGVHPFLHGLQRLDPEERVAAAVAAFPDLKRRILGGTALGDNTSVTPSVATSGGLTPQQLSAGAATVASGGAAVGRVTVAAAAAAVAAGPKGTSTGPSLLDDVSVLLSGTAAARGRLGTGAGGGEDDGICLDDGVAGSGGGGGSIGGVGGPAATGVSLAVDEVVVERWYEYESREPTGAWAGDPPLPSTTPPTGDASGDTRAAAAVAADRAGGGGGVGPARREDVALPGCGGWRWDGDWVVERVGGRVDEEGWEYRTDPGEGSAGATQRGWAAECGPEATRRRRCWLRRRRRRPQSIANTVQDTPTPVGRQQAHVAALTIAPVNPAAVAAAAAAAAGLTGGNGGVAGGCSEGDGMVLVVVALCALLRGCHLLESKRACISLLHDAALLCDDDTRLQRAVPFLVTQVSDSSTAVRTLALRCLVRLVSSVRTLPPGDAKVYHDYLLPSLSLLPNDPEEGVRVEYALAVAHLAASAHRHLVGLQYSSTGGGTDVGASSGGGPAELASDSKTGEASSGTEVVAPAAGVAAVADGTGSPVRFDAEVAAVRGAVERAVLDLITGARSSPDIKRALLSHAPRLAVFFGRRDVNDVLLPLLITCLNAGSWQLRGAFFGAVAGMGPHGGRDSLDVFLLPCLEQALADQEAAVVADAVGCVAAVARHLRQRNLLAAAKKIVPLLQHPAAAVRQASVAFVVAAAQALPPADVYTQLRAMVTPRLTGPPLAIDDEEHLGSLLRSHQDSNTPTPNKKQQRSQDGATRPSSSSSALPNEAPQLPALPLVGLYTDVPAPTAATAAAAAQVAGGGELRSCGQLLRPAAPLYAVELDPAVVGGGIGGSSGFRSSTVQPGQGVGYGFRSDGFGSFGPNAGSSSSGIAAAAAAAAIAAAAGGGTPMGSVKVSSAAAAPTTPQPSLGSTAPRPASALGSCGGGGGGSLGTTAAPGGCGSEGGLRPRLRSANAAAVESLGVRLLALEEARAALANRLNRGGEALEGAGSRHELERLTATINRLRQPAGTDVRDPRALTPHKLLALATRLAPAAAGGEGGQRAAGGGGAMPSTHNLLQGGFPDTAGSPLSGVGGVSDAVSAALSAGISGATGLPNAAPAAAIAAAAGATGPSWRPRGVMVSHLAEHRRAVNRLALSGNGHLLLSASDDETVKVWDVRRLERDVSFRSRLTYTGQTGAITAVAGVEDGAGVASASANGSLHVWRVDYTCRPGSGAPDKYTGITVRRQVSPGEGRILDVQQWGATPPLLIYATQRGGVHGLDPRMERDAWVVPAPPELGLLQQVAADSSGRHWLLLGTDRGWLRLWDVRFLVCANSWRHPGRCSIDAMAPANAAPSRLGLSPSTPPTPGAPLVYIAAGHGEVGLWDIATGTCLQVLRTLTAGEADPTCMDIPLALRPPTAVRAGSSTTTPASTGAGGVVSRAGGGPQGGEGEDLTEALRAGLCLHEVDAPQARPQSTCALLPLGGGQLLSGGADRVIRCWEPAWPERSYQVAGPVWPGSIIDPPTNMLNPAATQRRYQLRHAGMVPVVEEVAMVGDAARQTRLDAAPDLGSRMRMHDACHADCITTLMAAEGAHGRMLLSASRDGVIKAWK